MSLLILAELELGIGGSGGFASRKRMHVGQIPNLENHTEGNLLQACQASVRTELLQAESTTGREDRGDWIGLDGTLTGRSRGSGSLRPDVPVRFQVRTPTQRRPDTASPTPSRADSISAMPSEPLALSIRVRGVRCWIRRHRCVALMRPSPTYYLRLVNAVLVSVAAAIGLLITVFFFRVSPDLHWCRSAFRGSPLISDMKCSTEHDHRVSFLRLSPVPRDCFQ
jgi:hypothetical protein